MLIQHLTFIFIQMSAGIAAGVLVLKSDTQWLQMSAHCSVHVRVRQMMDVPHAEPESGRSAG